MLTNLLLLILEAVAGFFTLALLGRFYMQWSRVSFRNQIGQFLVALTDWIVIPVRRVVPGLFGLDLASVVLAWLAQTLLLAAELWLRGAAILGAGALPALLVLGLFEVARVMIYLLIGVVIIAAILSWVNPYSPVAPLFHSLSRPFLRPVQRIVPPIANIDLSPLVALLVFQIALMLLASLRASILPMIAE
jgi:YggT family protein